MMKVQRDVERKIAFEFESCGYGPEGCIIGVEADYEDADCGTVWYVEEDGSTQCMAWEFYFDDALGTVFARFDELVSDDDSEQEIA